MPARSSTRVVVHLAGGAVFAGTLLVATSIWAQPGLFVEDYFGGNVYTYTPAGDRSLFASGLSYPTGLAFDNGNNLYAAELGGNIYIFSPGGTRSLFAAGVGTPNVIVFDRAGNLYVDDYFAGNIYKLTPDGARSTFASGLYYPQGMACDSAGNLFVAEEGMGRIDQFSPSGTQSIFASGLSHPYGLALDRASNLYAVEGTGGGFIYRFTPEGVRSTFAANAINVYNNLAFDRADNLWVAQNVSLMGEIMVEFAPDGTQMTTFSCGLGTITGLAVPAVPEPSALALLAVGGTALLVHRGKQCVFRWCRESGR